MRMGVHASYVLHVMHNLHDIHQGTCLQRHIKVSSLTRKTEEVSIDEAMRWGLILMFNKFDIYDTFI